jgi:hypothetical protein
MIEAMERCINKYGQSASFLLVRYHCIKLIIKPYTVLSEKPFFEKLKKLKCFHIGKKQTTSHVCI